MKKYLVVVASVFAVALFAAPSCFSKAGYSFQPKATKVGWTAYKFTRKAAVNGHFAKFKATGTTRGKSIQDILKGFQFEIDSASVKTGNPARDINIAMNFFKKFTGGPTIKASVQKVEAKKLHVELSVHGLKKTVVFDYKLDKLKLVATATIDMLKLGLKAPFDSIHGSCKGLHTGKDGKSKTWTDVKLTLATTFLKK